MKKPNIVLLTILSIIFVVAFILCANHFGRKFPTIVNNPSVIELKERPSLKDDYYDYVNYELLKTNNIKEDESQWFYMYSKSAEMIKESKENTIKNILSQCTTYEENTVYKKICDFYNSYKNNNNQELINQLKTYIDKVNNAKDIKEYVDTVIDLDKELSLDIVINPSANKSNKSSTVYFSLNPLSYDFENGMFSELGVDLTTIASSIYTEKDYLTIMLYLNKYSSKNLINLGYDEETSKKISSNAQLVYSTIGKDSLSTDQYTNNKGYTLYDLEELKKNIKNINIDKLLLNYPELYQEGNKILVVDMKQLKAIDAYLDEKNLPALKDYATSKIANTYSRYINSNSYNEYLKLYDYLLFNIFGMYNNSIKEFDSEKLVYANIYSFFMDTIVHDIETSIITPEEKEFYKNLVIDEINIFKENILNENWLTQETREKAYKKLDNMKYKVSLPDELVYVENNYTIDTNYLNNIISINKQITEESSKQALLGNIDYGFDYLTQNAFYLPDNNSINILLGEIYSVRYANDVNSSNYQDKYYEILGSLGVVIGHELTHSLDNTGSKYDEYGNYLNWWTEKDKEEFNKLNSRVVKYYYNYKMFGNETLGENIADLGGMKLSLALAAKKNATNDNYKTIFESFAKSWCSQEESYYRYLLTEMDEHSANKVRVNAVLSSTDKFYEVYDIKPGDKMYYDQKDRVSVW